MCELQIAHFFQVSAFIFDHRSLLSLKKGGHGVDTIQYTPYNLLVNGPWLAYVLEHYPLLENVAS
jgi:hypothetical protein